MYISNVYTYRTLLMSDMCTLQYVGLGQHTVMYTLIQSLQDEVLQ